MIILIIILLITLGIIIWGGVTNWRFIGKREEYYKNDLEFYLVSIERSRKIREEGIKNLKKKVKEYFNKEMKTFGVDAKKLTEKDIKKYQDENIFPKGNWLSMPRWDPYCPKKAATQKGCFLSHILIWKDMIKNNVKYAIVLEDDAKLLDNFKNNLDQILQNLPKSFDYISLFHFSPNQDGFIKNLPKYNKDLYRIKIGLWGTTGYLISLQRAKNFVKEFLPIVDCVDEAISLYEDKKKDGYVVIKPLVGESVHNTVNQEYYNLPKKVLAITFIEKFPPNSDSPAYSMEEIVEKLMNNQLWRCVEDRGQIEHCTSGKIDVKDLGDTFDIKKLKNFGIQSGGLTHTMGCISNFFNIAHTLDRILVLPRPYQVLESTHGLVPKSLHWSDFFDTSLWPNYSETSDIIFRENREVKSADSKNVEYFDILDSKMLKKLEKSDVDIAVLVYSNENYDKPEGSRTWMCKSNPFSNPKNISLKFEPEKKHVELAKKLAKKWGTFNKMHIRGAVINYGIGAGDPKKIASPEYILKFLLKNKIPKNEKLLITSAIGDPKYFDLLRKEYDIIVESDLYNENNSLYKPVERTDSHFSTIPYYKDYYRETLTNPVIVLLLKELSKYAKIKICSQPGGSKHGGCDFYLSSDISKIK